MTKLHRYDGDGNILVTIVNAIDPAKVDAIEAQMLSLGYPKIRVIDGGDIYYAIEGSHRLIAAARSGTKVEIEVLDEDETIDLATIDIDTMGYFDGATVIPVTDFIAWFMRWQPTHPITVQPL